MELSELINLLPINIMQIYENPRLSIVNACAPAIATIAAATPLLKRNDNFIS